MRPEIEQELSHTLLTELLAYQFASPVRWIETQDVFLKDNKTERVVEIGPSPTLAGMASRTIKAKYESFDAALSLQRQVLCYSKDANQIYYTPDPADLESDKPSITKSLNANKADTPAATATESAPAASPAAPVPAQAPAPVPAPSGPVASVADEAVSAGLIVQVLVAQKLKKPLDAVPMSKAIKDLVNGKSTVQNEILGDLGKEFGSTPEKPEDTPLQELAEQFQDSFSGQLGKTTSGLVGRLMSSKMPGGFSVTSARKYLDSRYGFAAGRQDSVLLLALVNEPANRLGSENDAKSFLDGMAQKHASMAGISLNSGAEAAGGAGGAAGAVIDSAALDAVTAENKNLAKQQLETLARYLKVDLNKGAKSFVKEKEASAVLQKELDLWEEEHGEFYAKGIKPIFSPLKARTYDSYWNWARQDVLSMYFDIIFGKLTSVDRETINQCIQIMNRSNPTLIKFMQYHIDHTPEYKGETYQLAKKLGQQLIDNCKQVLDVDPAFKDVSKITKPHTNIDARGQIDYNEIESPSVRKFEQYVYEMAQGGEITKQKSKPTIKDDLARVYKAIVKQQNLSADTKLDFQSLYTQLIDYIDSSKEIDNRAIATGTATPVEEAEDILSSPATSDDEIASLPDKTSILQPVSSTIPQETIPFLHIQRKTREGWEYDHKLSSTYLDGLESCAINGLTFKDKHVLVTGAGAGSIGAEVLQGLISGGAKVIVTTSRFSKKTTEYYQTMYSRYGAAGSTLIVVPFNQGSVKDVNALVDYIYNDPKQGGLGWDLDIIVPFAAIPENGNGLDNIDSKSELAHRIMLTNVLRLLGGVKSKKSTDTRPAQVILPLSPNHGTFGFDGLYSESKISLETLFNRWYSEDWGTRLTICGAVIGWTRGTGLMSANNIIAEGFEKLGVRTFSQKEMAFNILGLMTPELTQLCQEEPILADLNGGFQYIDNLKDVTTKLRTDLLETADVKRAVSLESSIEQRVVNGENVDNNYAKVKVQARSNMKFDFPGMKSYKEIKEIAPDLEGMLDLESVVVVTGFSEVGPWGNSRTRWEMEANGEFSIEGAIEMAWIMGLIKYHNGKLKGKPYSGWVDAKTQAPVEDHEIKAKYEEHILEHSGIRLVEPELFGGYDPNKKKLIQEVVVQHDLEPFEASKEVAEQYKLQHGDKCEIFEDEESGEYSIKILTGATLYIPKALKFDRLVAGQIPTGWNAKTYGIDDDIISQVDPVTLFALVATVEALLASGVTDPYEFYKYIHLSELGNCIGSGMGGMTALKGIFKDRYEEKQVQNDILQESFINTMPAWINMLLLSSSGPIRTPVGACATAIESVELGIETILAKKAKICVVGGLDDFQEESSHEFANMNATSNTYDEFDHGRTPAEMSRPTTTTRSGFMESQGSGVQVVMSADLAIKMGVPIYGILAMSATASDKIGKSVPAPGKGILTTAREYHGDLKFPSSKLNIKYRARQLKNRLAQIESWRESEIDYLYEEAELAKESYNDFEEEFVVEEFLAERSEEIDREAKRQIADAKRQWGNDFYKSDPRIAPLRGAMATFGLTIDDLGVASFHGTSTKANDKNETLTVHSMMKHLGRTEGNPVYGVFQKFLTGHPKGAAGAWMLNGALQILQTGLVPGNRNADNVDQILQEFDYVMFPSRSIQTDGIKAVSVTSFGFGQKGAQAIVIHPDYLYAVLDQASYEEYAAKVVSRNKKTYRYMHNAITRNTMFVQKNDAPYVDDLEKQVYLDPLARVSEGKDLKFANKTIQASASYISESSNNIAKALSTLNKSNKGVGVDVELLSSLNLENETFIERNFTKGEQEYCLKSPDPRASFTGTWSAKEAVFKALGVKSQGAGAALVDIQVVRSATGAPKVNLVGAAKAAAEKAGVKNVSVSISHDDFQATAVALSEY
ncbi:3-oxoacyl-[acyl-carrier-protein] synthase [Yamadazyma tenuis]|uniref:Fatty acid synthase subunit alpha n=1 Tax=Candida tenuis (strain ATCC 10573 / BCRC 21748 / CBS 615 / JCM 9827 / NBRC 10315 / NRRL Y-1498 / VKM Y-70) TaxID=590646 RepID=G3BDA0_CANTC|nr:fatty acid synthase subunit alpha [Yamadazyma tenuis ATCC 10573]EGV60278.1 fatty acid synthase subunit alpha [Yamadazyma tenuis ATCC 10573]WEJ94479.1 3-oxoacyl-[acyl-carrier-protein] synthase [Yamadazyma tenuis]